MMLVESAPSVMPGGVPDAAGNTAGASGGASTPEAFLACLANAAEAIARESGSVREPSDGDPSIDEGAIGAVATPPIVLPVIAVPPAQPAEGAEAPGPESPESGEGGGNAIDGLRARLVAVVHQAGPPARDLSEPSAPPQVPAAGSEPDRPAAEPARPLTSSAPGADAAPGEVPTPSVGNRAGDTLDTAPALRDAARTGVPAGQAAVPGKSSTQDASLSIASPAQVEPGSITHVAPDDSAASTGRRSSHEQPVIEGARTGANRARTGNGPLVARALDAASSAAAAPPAGQAAAGNQQEGGGHFDGRQPRSVGEWLRQQLAPSSAGGGRPSLTHGPLPTVVDPVGQAATADASFLVPGGQPAGPASGALAERDLIGQLVHSLRMQFRDGVGEAVLRLKPEHLGSISIAVRVENGGLRATVQAEAPAVRQWLESQQESLRSGLAEHGLRLDRFVVNPEGRRESPSQEHGEDRPQHRRPPRQPPRSHEPVFDVVA